MKNEDSAGQGYGYDDKADEQAQPSMQETQGFHPNGIVLRRPAEAVPQELLTFLRIRVDRTPLSCVRAPQRT